MFIKREDLQRLCPRPNGGDKAKNWDGYVDSLCGIETARLLDQFGITTSMRWQHLVATWAHETGGFQILWESGAYSAERLMVVFRDKDMTWPEARAIQGNAYAIFERVYGLGCPRMARMLGNTQVGDGYRFRGLGIEQITGREAHEKYAGIIGCSLEDLALPINSIKAALLEWKEKGCNAKADRDDVDAVRVAINGGRNGLDDVKHYLAGAKRIWARLSSTAVPTPAQRLVLDAADGPDGPGADQGAASSASWDAVVQGGAEGAVAGAAPVLLQQGDENDRVLQLQQRLAEAGYHAGIQDGKFGTLTFRAVAAYQASHGLPGTGMVDQDTWDAVMASKPVDAVPGRGHIDGAALQQRGDPIYAVLRAKVLAAITWFLGLFGLTIDSLFSLGGAELAIDKAQQVQSVTRRVSGVFDLRIIAAVLFLALAAWGLVSAVKAIACYIDSVRKGAVLGGQQS